MAAGLAPRAGIGLGEPTAAQAPSLAQEAPSVPAAGQARLPAIRGSVLARATGSGEAGHLIGITGEPHGPLREPGGGIDRGLGLADAVDEPTVLPGLVIRPLRAGHDEPAGTAGLPADVTGPPWPDEQDRAWPGRRAGQPQAAPARPVDIDAIADRVIARLARQHRLDWERRG